MDIESGKEQPPGAQPPTHGYIQGKGDLDTRVLHVLVALISRPLSSQSSSDVDPIWNSNQEYLIDHNTVVHGLAPQGEKGPIVNKDTAIGFNTRRNNNDEIPYITEIWLLNE